MKGWIWLLLTAFCWATPEYLKVKVEAYPPDASLLCGLDLRRQEPGQSKTAHKDNLKVKLKHLPEDGIVDLRLGTDYSGFSDNLAVGLEAPGYAPYTTNVSLKRLEEGQPGPVPLFPSPVRLTPISWQAYLSEKPWILIGAVLVGMSLPFLLLRLLRQRRQLGLQYQREQRLASAGLQRQGWTGRVVDGVHILGELGSGGMATVYEAESEGQSYALKILHQGARDPKYVSRFQREVSICSRLRHPRIVLLYRALEGDGLLGLLMEKVDGETLRAHIKPGGLPVETVSDWFAAISEGLFYAHHQGVVHRDLKPDNLMLTPQGKIKIMDFGIARRQDGPALTETGAVIGTIAYMAPEQIQGGEITPLADQYAMGVVLFELLTGRLPYLAENPLEVFHLHLSGEVPNPCRLRPDLSPGVGQVVERMLAKNPADRFGDIERAARTFRYAVKESHP